MEHVGSASVKGLAFKTILDIDIVIEEYEIFQRSKNFEKMRVLSSSLEWTLKEEGVLEERIRSFHGTRGNTV